jgi:DNA repair exonuclease SbcCD ATPase subunit
VERAARLKEQFKVAEEKLNDTVEQERKVQEQLDELEKPKEKGGDDDDDDDDLFGDDEEDDEAVSFIRCFFFFSCNFSGIAM